MKELTLRIKNDQLARTIMGLLSKIKDIEIIEGKGSNKGRKRSKIDEIIEKPYEIDNFKIFSREEIYENSLYR